MHVFVYGTLVPGDVRYHFVEPYVAARHRTTATGRVYDTGLGYPAARFDQTGTIEGWVYELKVGIEDEALDLLDEVEGVVEGQYRRVQVRTSDGVEAWAYEVGIDTESMVDLDGRWLEP